MALLRGGKRREEEEEEEEGGRCRSDEAENGRKVALLSVAPLIQRGRTQWRREGGAQRSSGLEKAGVSDWAHLGVHGWAWRARWVEAHCRGPEKLRGEKGLEGPQQEEVQAEAHESLDGQEVLVGPGGLELDWWLETFLQSRPSAPAATSRPQAVAWQW